MAIEAPVIGMVTFRFAHAPRISPEVKRAMERITICLPFKIPPKTISSEIIHQEIFSYKYRLENKNGHVITMPVSYIVEIILFTRRGLSYEDP
jgi:hypothetical protein